MASIDISTFRGETPKVAPHLLQDQMAVAAIDCDFSRGVIEPLHDDMATGIQLPIKPRTIFHYRDNFWFAWAGRVSVMRSPVAKDAYGRVYFTDGAYPKVTTAAIATGGSSYPTAWYRLGIPAPDTVIGIGAVTPPADAGEDDPTDDETRYYVQTWVTGSGEEGPPSEASAEVTIVIPGSSVVLQLQSPGANDRDIQRRRIYRSATSDTSADYLLLAELPIAQGTYVDGKSDSELSASLSTYDYLPPPADMQGICLMANGIAAGFAGNSILFSEAYLPYAWPEGNRLTTEHDIVAIAAIGTALVVGTKGYPYLCQGVTPSGITATRVDMPQSCVSADSMVSMDGVVIYAGPDGLCAVSAGGASLVTEQIITRDQWQAMRPETLRAWHHDGKYIAITDTSAFVYDPKGGDLRTISNRWDAAYNDMVDDTLYIAHGTALAAWADSDSISTPYRWRSKVFHANGLSFGTARVRHGPGDVTLTVFLDGGQVCKIHNVPDSAFRLPCLRGDRWQVEVTGNASVERIQLATSMAEIA